MSWNLSCSIFSKMFCLFAPLFFHYCLLLSYINIYNFQCTNWILSLSVYTHIQMYFFPSGYPHSYSELKAISNLIYFHIKLISIVCKNFALIHKIFPFIFYCHELHFHILCALLVWFLCIALWVVFLNHVRKQKQIAFL